MSIRTSKGFVFAVLAGLAATACSDSTGSDGAGGASAPSAVCGHAGVTLGSSYTDQCVSLFCCDWFNPCVVDAACAACIAGTGTGCSSNALYGSLLTCIQQNNCLGGAGGSGHGGGGGAGGASGGAGAAGSAGASGGAGVSGGGGTAPDGGTKCAVDSDCATAVPPTTPPGCAEGVCDVTTGGCLVRAKDADSDGYRAQQCVSSDASVTVTLGDDCDDGNESVHPGGWDGPLDPADPTARPDRCNDGVDQNCSGADGDMQASNGATCLCTPGDESTCSEDSGGIPITWPGGVPNPGSPCKYGVKTCSIDAQTSKPRWGQCVGAVPPAIEVCNGGIDDDCKGDGDALASDKPMVCADADGDSYCQEQTCKTSESCGVSAGWNLGSVCAGKSEPAFCDGNDAANPGIPEVCNGVDDDCDGTTDEGVKTEYWFDDDDDNHAPAGVAAVSACAPPAVCPSEVPSCSNPSRWKTGLTPDDCNDGDPTCFPGSPDSPTCDGKDHDCDGKANTGCGCQNGATQTCYESETNVCNKQVVTCVDGKWPECPPPVYKTEYCEDKDGDGHCSLNCQPACSSPGGVWKSGCPKDDCNDDAATIYPGYPESPTCDGTDHDCDGTPNEGCACTTGTTSTCHAGNSSVCNQDVITCSGGQWPACPNPIYKQEYCLDADGDSHCTTSCQMACSAPAKHKPSCAKDDCDDGRNWVYPGASETCGDGINADCDSKGLDSNGFNVGVACSAGVSDTCCYRTGT
ncbi:MAG TPA: putative metal-binding motif-containing protein, partial [Polyangiaceae bacterium]|nr:putative metal-binding motif-containing protein [Polyangiaceae bacterium]